MRAKIIEINKKIEAARKRSKKLYADRDALLKKAQASCLHKRCAERMTYGSDDWANLSWHNYTRICQECFLVEEGKRNNKNYSYQDEYNLFDILADSKVINRKNSLSSDEWQKYKMPICEDEEDE